MAFVEREWIEVCGSGWTWVGGWILEHYGSLRSHFEESPKNAYFYRNWINWKTPMIGILLDPHSNWAWIRIRIRIHIRNPDPYSESGSGTRIQMSKNRLKKPKFTVTDFKNENRKMLQLSYNFNHSFLSLFQELITHDNFLLSCTVKKLYIEYKFFADCINI